MINGVDAPPPGVIDFESNTPFTMEPAILDFDDQASDVLDVIPVNLDPDTGFNNSLKPPLIELRLLAPPFVLRLQPSE